MEQLAPRLVIYICNNTGAARSTLSMRFFTRKCVRIPSISQLRVLVYGQNPNDVHVDNILLPLLLLILLLTFNRALIYMQKKMHIFSLGNKTRQMLNNI